MNAIAGAWELKLKTPIGTLAVTYDFVETTEGLTGTATTKDETVTLTDITTEEISEGERVTWRQSVTRPMRLDLDFDVIAIGDELTGHSRAGRLPRTKVTGSRLSH
ncbi:hypothetical protein ACXIZN_16120 [Amycolatopsis sp. TRM77291]